MSTAEKKSKVKEPVSMKQPGFDELAHIAPKKCSFTGIARSVEAYNHEGFRNFRIVTLHIEEGVVQRSEYSDPYASFEAISRLELWNEKSVIHLNSNWKNGETLRK